MGGCAHSETSNLMCSYGKIGTDVHTHTHTIEEQ